MGYPLWVIPTTNPEDTGGYPYPLPWVWVLAGVGAGWP
jgi:hypothetical protein